MIEVIDYGGGNIGSVLRCLDRLDIPYAKRSCDEPPTGNAPMLLPGVGAFGATMANLSRNNLHTRIIELVRQGVPYLGICVGLQVLLNSSEETPEIAGLGLVPGRVVRFTQGKIPQIGWNAIKPREKSTAPEGFVYFVNSYYAQPDDPADILYEADYGTRFCAAIKHQNITAFQFHPEKSGPFGHQLVRGWYDEQS